MLINYIEMRSPASRTIRYNYAFVRNGHIDSLITNEPPAVFAKEEFPHQTVRMQQLDGEGDPLGAESVHIG